MMGDDQLEYRDIGTLRENPLNPRGTDYGPGIDELAASIKAQGILQPLLITDDGLVVAGHRRLVAARLAGLAKIPVVVRTLAATEQLELMLIENVQREGLRPLQEARAYQRLLNEGATVADLTRRLGFSRPRIDGRLLLLTFDTDIQERFDRGFMPLSLAPILAGVKDPMLRKRAIMMASRTTMTAAGFKSAIQKMLADKGRKPQTRRVHVTRREPAQLLKELRNRPTQVFTAAKVGEEMTMVCETCGLSRAEGICADCPVVAMITRLLGMSVWQIAAPGAA